MSFKKGDKVRCTSSSYVWVLKGEVYTVQRDVERGAKLVWVIDKDGDPNDYPIEDFELVKPATRKLKLPLLFQTIGNAKYVMTYDGSAEGKVSVINAVNGEVYTNHVTEDGAIEYFKDGTWIVQGEVKLKQDVEAAKAALAKAEEALANSAAYLA